MPEPMSDAVFLEALRDWLRARHDPRLVEREGGGSIEHLAECAAEFCRFKGVSMPKPQNDLPEWQDADRISDRIVDLIREEMKRPGYSPVQIFAGQMLAMMSMLKSAPPSVPEELVLVRQAIEICLHSMMGPRPS